MKFKDIYQRAITYWPAEIDISDGKVIAETNGFRSDNLSNSWDLAEERSKNEWETLMAWIIFKALHDAAILRHNEGQMFLQVKEVLKLDLLQEYFIEELQEEGYEDMLANYSN
jgi:hypothetical protein